MDDLGSVPGSRGLQGSFKQVAILLAFNIIYFLRAKTEEANLSSDPVYVQYAEWMEAENTKILADDQSFDGFAASVLMIYSYKYW